MADVNPLHEKILQACQAQAPEPLYPRPFAIAEQLDRGELDDALDELRGGGLIELTDWADGMGQGYTLTADGARFLEARLAPPSEAPEEDEATRLKGQAIRRCLLEPARPVLTRIILFTSLLTFGYGWHLASQRDLSSVYLTGMPKTVDEAEALSKLFQEMGSLQPQLVLAGEWWRLLSHAFLHAGLLHLAVSMFFLYSVGSVAENLWGRWRFALLYAVGAAAGGAALCLGLQPAPPGMAGLRDVGAMGALCGVLLSTAVWLFMSRKHLSADQVSKWKMSLIMSILLLGLLSFLPGVSWAPSLGGAVGGGVLGVFLHLNRFGGGALRWVGLAGMGAVPAAIVGMVFLPYNETREIRQYHAILQRHRDLDLQMRQFWKNHGHKLYEDGPASLADDAPKARDSINQLLRQLKAVSDELQARQFRSEKIRKHEPRAREFLDWQLNLAEVYEQALARPDDWNVPAQARLWALLKDYDRKGKDLFSGP